MKEIPLTQGKVALVDDEDFEWLDQWKWSATLNDCVWYAVREDSSNRKIYMHRLIMGEPAGAQVDHKDGVGLNNQRGNLRTATRSQNQWNSRKRLGRSSKYKGVSWRKDCERWRAQIRHPGVKRHLGLFTSEVQAARAYDSAAKKLYGEFACLNFPTAQVA